MITDSRRKFLEELCDIICKNRILGKPFIVGITGVDTAGKTQLVTELEEILGKTYPVQAVHVDNFHNEKSVRYNPALTEPEQYFTNSIDFNRLAQEVLSPIRELGRLDTSLTHLDLLTDTWTKQCHYSITPDTIVLLEGVFLFRPETSAYIDFFVYLHVPEDVVMERARLRDVPILGEEIIQKYDSKYFPAQRDYINKYRPHENAHVLVDNTDWRYPTLQVQVKDK